MLLSRIINTGNLLDAGQHQTGMPEKTFEFITDE